MKEIIKEHLESKNKRIYSIIVNEYYTKIKELKPKYFVLWLAKELNVKNEFINIHSLKSAVARREKTGNEEKKKM